MSSLNDASHQNSPCSRLPDEILLSIFLYDKPSTAIVQIMQFLRIRTAPDGLERDLWKSAFSWIDILHVCQRWRKVAMSFGPMWTNVASSHRLDLTEFMLEHSKKLPLTVTYSLDNSEKAAVTRLLSQIHRIETLEVLDADENAVAELSGALAGLNENSILHVLLLMAATTTPNLNRMPVLDDKLFAVLPSSITTILYSGKIRGVFTGPPLSNLTDCSILIYAPPRLSSIFSLLVRLPSVRTLSLAVSGVDIDEDLYETFGLSDLQVLVWNENLDLLHAFFRTIQVPKDLHLDLSYAIGDENVLSAFSFIQSYQNRQGLSFPCVTLAVNDTSTGGSPTRTGYIILSLHSSIKPSCTRQHTDVIPRLISRQQAGLYVTCPYKLTDADMFHLMLHELFEALPVAEIQHFTFSVRFKEDKWHPLLLPALDDLTALTHLTLDSAAAIMTVAASMQTALKDSAANQVIIPSLRHLHIIGVPPRSPPDVEEEEPFDTLLDALALRAERAIFLDTLRFTECGIDEVLVARFRKEAVAKEAVICDTKPTKAQAEPP